MQYYSDITEKLYESIEALENAEKEVAEQKAQEEAKIAEEKAKKEALSKERGERAKVVEEAIVELTELRKECSAKIREKEKSVRDLIDDFVKDYGSFHYSYRSGDDMPTVSLSKYAKHFNSLFDEFFQKF